MATAKEWLRGARCNSLPASLSSVVIGTACAYNMGAADPLRATLAGLVALTIQLGVNFANDYSDGLRGTDSKHISPERLVARGIVNPKHVLMAAMISLGLSGAFGMALVVISGQWILAVGGGLAIAAAWFYTGGRYPYGYYGLGDLSVFLFFGLFGTVGTTLSQAGRLDAVTWIAAVGTAFITCALLMVDNLRDIETDPLTKKVTIAVLLGDRGARIAYISELSLGIIAGCACAFYKPWSLLVLGSVPLVAMCIIPVLRGEHGPQLIPARDRNGMLQTVYAVLLGIGIAL